MNAVPLLPAPLRDPCLLKPCLSPWNGLLLFSDFLSSWHLNNAQGGAAGAVARQRWIVWPHQCRLHVYVGPVGGGRCGDQKVGRHARFSSSFDVLSVTLFVLGRTLHLEGANKLPTGTALATQTFPGTKTASPSTSFTLSGAGCVGGRPALRPGMGWFAKALGWTRATPLHPCLPFAAPQLEPGGRNRL